MAVVGLDVGTTQIKCGVFEYDGKLKNTYSSEYPIVREKNIQYVDASAMWSHVKRVLALASKDNLIEAVCVTSFGESFVAVDGEMNILDNVMLYTDTRGSEEALILGEKISDREVFEITGNKIHSMYSLPKLMWVKSHHPEVYQKAKYFLPISSFIIYMLSGEAVTDYSLAARTMILDIEKKTWSKKLLELGGIDEKKLPLPVISGTIAGKIFPSIANELGLSPDCVVVVGGQDQVCSALGAGVLDAGSSVDGIGTVECVTPVFDKQFKDENARISGFSCVPYVKENMYVTYMFNYSGGASIKWFQDKIVPENVERLNQIGGSFFAYYAERMPDDPTGLLVLPHFNGAATPYMDTGARGAIMNIDISTTAADIYKGIMEGCSYEMRLNLEYGEKSGIHVKELTVTGGGAKDAKWMQIKADIMGMPIYPLAYSDAGIAGCAMLAMVAIGKVKSLKEAVELVVKKKQPYLPNPKQVEKYNVIYSKYKKLYELAKEIR